MKVSEINHSGIKCLLLLMALCLAGFLPVFTEGKVIAPMDIQENFLPPWGQDTDRVQVNNHFVSDAVTQYLPYRMFAQESYRQDGYLGWNPYAMGGFNMAGNTMALPGSWTTQLHRFLPFNVAWNFGIIAEFLVAGVGMLAFLRCRKLPWACCLFGAIAFMGNSQFIVWIYHRWTVGSFCWMPWILWASRGLFVENEWRKRYALLPLFLGLAILGGTLQHIVFIVFACGCLVMGRWSFYKPFKPDWVYSIKWSLLFIFVFGLISFSLAPQIQAYLTNIEAGHIRGGIGYADGVQQVPLNLIAIPAQFWPWLMGDPQTLDGSKLLKLNYFNIAYFGTIPMILAIVGLFRKSMPKAAKWMITLGLIIPLTPLVGPLYHRVQIVFILGGCWMAAEVLSVYLKNPPVKLVKYSVIVVVAIGALLIGGSALPAQYRNSIEQEVVAQTLAQSGAMQFGGNEEWLTSRALEWTSRFSIAHPKTLLVFSLLALGVLGLCLLKRNEKFGNTGGIILILVVTLELGLYQKYWVSYSDEDQIKPGHPSIARLKQITDGERVYQGSAHNGITSTFGSPNILSSYFIPTLDAYESIQYKSVAQTLVDYPDALKYNLSNVRYCLAPLGGEPYPGTELWAKVESIGSFVLYENPEAIPMIISIASDKGNSVEDMYEQLRSGAAIEPAKRTMNTVEFVVPHDSAYVRYGQNWHEGWKWKSKHQKSWSAVQKGADGATWIPSKSSAGEVVQLAFCPRPRWTIYLSGLCALSLLLFVALQRKRRGRNIIAS